MKKPLDNINHAIIRPQLIQLQKLSDLVGWLQPQKRGRLLLVADDRTYEAAGREVSLILQSLDFSVQECILTRSTPLVPDETALDEIRAACRRDIGTLWAVGSGSINDLMKYISHERRLPLITLATAASMDGYTSSVSALTIEGFKETVTANPPGIVLSVTEVLAKAPAAMTAAGIGDLMGKYTSLADWKISQFVNDEPISEELAARVREAVVLATADRSGISHDECLQRIMNAIIVSGDVMLEWGNSRPASGAEHHLSHFWELQAEWTGRPDHLHGEKVGVATVLMSELYHRIFALDKGKVKSMMARRVPETSLQFEKRIREAYGILSGSVIAGLKGIYLDETERIERQLRILDRWDAMKAWVREFVPETETVKSMLRDAGAPMEPSEIDVDGDLLAKALIDAKEMRSRYTILRLAEDIGFGVI